eukprot:10616981-Heterocapsa_arctica.AAC.1
MADGARESRVLRIPCGTRWEDASRVQPRPRGDETGLRVRGAGAAHDDEGGPREEVGRPLPA